MDDGADVKDEKPLLKDEKLLLKDEKPLLKDEQLDVKEEKVAVKDEKEALDATAAEQSTQVLPATPLLCQRVTFCFCYVPSRSCNRCICCPQETGPHVPCNHKCSNSTRVCVPPTSMS